MHVYKVQEQFLLLTQSRLTCVRESQGIKGALQGVFNASTHLLYFIISMISKWERSKDQSGDNCFLTESQFHYHEPGSLGAFN